jgi:hypothetical protein
VKFNWHRDKGIDRGTPTKKVAAVIHANSPMSDRSRVLPSLSSGINQCILTAHNTARDPGG